MTDAELEALEPAIRFVAASKTYCSQYDLARSYALRDMVRGRRPTELRREEVYGIRELDLSVARGECIALLGPTASGKSTIAQLACGLTLPSFGEVTVRGLARWVSPAASGRTPYMTIAEYLKLTSALLGAEVDAIPALSEAAQRACGLDPAQDRTKLFNLPTITLRRLTTYLCLWIDAEIFIFDDPLKLKDPLDRELFEERFDEILGSKTTLLSARTPKELSPRADRTLLLWESYPFYLGEREIALELYTLLGEAGEETPIDALHAERETLIERAVERIQERARPKLPESAATTRGSTAPPPFDLGTFLEAEIAPLLERPEPILVGPYLSDSGLEGLYWSALLRSAARHLDIAPERWIALSRGGAECWYDGITGQYVDAYDLFSPEEFDALCRRRLDDHGLKQRQLDRHESRIIERAREHLGLDRVQLLHPGLMIRLLERAWSRPEDTTTLLEQLDFPTAAQHRANTLELPEEYVVARFDTFWIYVPDNRLQHYAMRAIVETLQEGGRPVVLAHTGHSLNDTFAACDELRSLTPHRIEAEPRRQLEVLSELYRRASVAVGTWGGISHLAPLHRRPTLGLFAEASANLALHIDAAERWMTRYEIPHRFARFADFDPDDVAAWVRDAIAQT